MNKLRRWMNSFRWRMDSFRIRFLLAMLLLATIIALVLFHPGLPQNELDNSILFLVMLAVVVLLLPWERITSLKAAGVEIALNQARIDRAMETVKGQGKNIADERLRHLLKRLEPQIEQAQGSRILWIDDQPFNVLGERRLFRALGIEIIMANSSKTAGTYMKMDGDFDLIISDVRGKNQNPPEAIRFIQDVRKSEEDRRRAGNYEHIPLVPVVFYSGHDWKEYRDLISELWSPESCIVWTSGVEELVQEVLHILYRIRMEPRRFVQNPDRQTPASAFPRSLPE